MKRIKPKVAATVTLTLLLASLTGRAAYAEPARYEIDPDHLSVGFLVEHIGFAKVLGMFRKASGSFQFDEQVGALSDIVLEIDAASVFSNHKKRDEHLRSADFLNANEFPIIKFHAARATKTGARTFELEGDLTLLGQTHPTTFTATWNKSAASPIGGSVFGGKPYVTGVSARGTFKRSQFGMNYAVSNGWVGDEVELIVEFEAQRQ